MICAYCNNEVDLTTKERCECATIEIKSFFLLDKSRGEAEKLQIESFLRYKKSSQKRLEKILGGVWVEGLKRQLQGMDLEKARQILNDKEKQILLDENSSPKMVIHKWLFLSMKFHPYISNLGNLKVCKPDIVPNLKDKAAETYRITKACQFIIENSLTLSQLTEIKEKIKKEEEEIITREEAREKEQLEEEIKRKAQEYNSLHCITCGKRLVWCVIGERKNCLECREKREEEEQEKLRLEKELEEAKLREQQEKTKVELERKKNDVYKRIANLNADEEGKLDRISDSAEIKKFFSNALTSRIINEISNCAMIRGDMVYIEEAKWIKSEECGSYGFGLFLPTDYQKIKNAFLAEIKTNPKNWKLVRSDHGIIDLHEMIDGKLTRVHHYPAFKFTGREEREIETILERAERERRNEGQQRQQFEGDTNVETEQGRPQRENEGETGKGVLQVFFVLFWVFVVIAFYWWAIRRIIKVTNIFKKGKERNKTLEIFLGTDWNNRKLIVFDYQPTEEEWKIFESRALVDISLSKLENNVLKTRDLLALVKYYESEGRIKKDSQINKLLLAKLKNFRSAGNSTSESKAYLSVNINGRVDRIIQELIHLKKVQMFEPIFW